ncbi:MAG: hypothetical protein H6Q16_2066 [Bacteroidetes bacterium]|nr:hypothetical protein [Bacteroidota bacterium]
MKKTIIFLILFSFIFINSYAQNNYNKRIDLEYWNISDNKNISIDNCKYYLESIYELLYNKKVIPHPFKNDNETKLGWIDSTTWNFSSLFNLNNEDLSNKNIILKCRNLNTYSTIYINNKPIAQTDNEFLEYSFNIKPYVNQGNNSIKIVIDPANRKLDYSSEEFNTLESEKRVISRKAQYRYGWDWFPKMLSVGFQNVFIDIYDNTPQFEYANIQTKEIDAKRKSSLMLLNIGFTNLSKGNYTIKLKDIKCTNNHSDKKESKYTFIKNKEYVFPFTKKDLDTLAVLNTKFTIKNPQLWYPNGFKDKQYLYSATIELIDNNGKESKLINKQTIDFGIRTIELVQEKDSIGQSFYFKVNGKPLFIKGANYIATESQYIYSIDAAVNANINMLRVWGGSRYLNDNFIRKCDELGILVWQDFPFACALYPADSSFLENVREEAIQNIKRIAKHPSLALWCGNNEIWEGWNNWGWKQEVKDTAKAVENYNKLFKELLPNIVKEYTPTINYIHTSPLHGWGRRESLTHGDCHYWGVWWGDSIFETYTRKVPRFMSEYGFQSPPTIYTEEEFMSKPYSKENPEFAIHQKHPRGFELIDNRIKEWYGNYTSDEDYMFKAEEIAQEAYKIAIEAHRRAMPYCMGTMFWQFNEPYPAISWSSIDYLGKTKSIYSTIFKSYQPIIFSIDKYSNPDSIFIYICNDSYDSYNIKYHIEVKDNYDKIKLSVSPTKIYVDKLTSKIIYSIAIKDIKSFNSKSDYLWIEGTIADKKSRYNGLRVISNYTFFVYPKDYIDINKYNEVKRKYYQ